MYRRSEGLSSQLTEVIRDTQSCTPNFALGNSSQTCRDSSQLRQHKHRSTINDNENTWWIKFQSETKCQTPLPCAVSGRPPEKHLRLKLIKACSHFQSLAVILKDTSNRIQFVLQLDNLAEAYLL
jgi:hypothetical protein